jgi:excisionase family DNA binding protein
MSKKLPAVSKITMSRAEAAEALGVTVQTITAYIAAKKLRASKPGRHVLIRLADIEAMLSATTI